jgi:hypothetical protein
MPGFMINRRQETDLVIFPRAFGAVAIRVFEITALTGQVVVLAVGILALAVSRVCENRPDWNGRVSLINSEIYQQNALLAWQLNRPER